MEPARRNRLLLIGLTITVLVAGATVVTIVALNNSGEDASPITAAQMARRVLENMPVIDGHNDFPWNLRNFVNNDLRKVNFSSNLKEADLWGNSSSSHTDIPRLREGHVGAQFWVAYTSCASQYKDSVEQTIEQIDVIRRLAANYSDDMQFATSADDIEDAISKGKIASLIGVEGGHSMQSSFGILRTLYQMGTRYMTLTHSCNTPWADSSPVDSPDPVIDPQNNGLSDFGLLVIDEMNRLGMMVDLSHVSIATMKAALTRSKAPVIFSHSSAKAICDHHRNVPDDVLQLTKEKNSIIMVNFYSKFVKCGSNSDGAPATLSDVVEHIQYIRNITGPDHIGIGGDFDGVDEVPVGLDDVSKYPDLFEALYATGDWSEEDLEKLAGRNLLRVFRDVERVRDELANADPQQDSLTKAELIEKKVNLSCLTGKFPDDEFDQSFLFN